MLKEQKRLEYIDIAKGILILFVILGHSLSGINKIAPHDSGLDFFLNVKELLWVPYYMPAFFVITGFCSNYDKPLKDFVISNFKSIKIPAMVFGVVYSLGHLFQHNGAMVEALKAVLLCPLHSGYWFLDALFISKILFWFVKRFGKNDFVRFLCVLFFLLLSLLWVTLQKNVDDFFCVLHGLILVFFLYIGYFLKKQKICFAKKWLLFWIPYVVLLAMLHILETPVPSVTRVINIDLFNSVPFVTLTLCGSFGILSVCYLIRKNLVLEYVGRNSLSFYVLHLIVLSPGLKIVKKIEIDNIYVELFCVFFFLLAFCFVFSFLLNKEKMKFLLGKF